MCEDKVNAKNKFALTQIVHVVRRLSGRVGETGLDAGAPLEVYSGFRGAHQTTC